MRTAAVPSPWCAIMTSLLQHSTVVRTVAATLLLLPQHSTVVRTVDAKLLLLPQHSTAVRTVAAKLLLLPQYSTAVRTVAAILLLLPQHSTAVRTAAAAPGRWCTVESSRPRYSYGGPCRTAGPGCPKPRRRGRPSCHPTPRRCAYRHRSSTADSRNLTHPAAAGAAPRPHERQTGQRKSRKKNTHK